MRFVRMKNDWYEGRYFHVLPCNVMTIVSTDEGKAVLNLADGLSMYVDYDVETAVAMLERGLNDVPETEQQER